MRDDYFVRNASWHPYAKTGASERSSCACNNHHPQPRNLHLPFFLFSSSPFTLFRLLLLRRIRDQPIFLFFFPTFLFFCLLKFSEKKRSHFSFRSSLSSFLFSLIDSFYLARFSVCPVVEISKQVENWNAEHVLISDRTRCNFEKIDDLIVRNNRLISWREIWRNLKNLSIPQQASMYYIVGYQLKIKKWRTRYINIKNIEKILLIWICTEEKKIIFPLRHR